MVTRLFGTPGGTRTHDQRIRNPLLYPAELQARLGGVVSPLFFTVFSRTADWTEIQCNRPVSDLTNVITVQIVHRYTSVF